VAFNIQATKMLAKTVAVVLLGFVSTAMAFQVSRMGRLPSCRTLAPRSQRQVVSMNLFDRFSRVAKANLNVVLNKLEDPEKVMTQSLIDLQSDLVKIRQSYAEVMATQKKMEKQKTAAEGLAEEWMGRAQLAIQKGDDELAREALTRKGTAAEQADALAKQCEAQTGSLNQLYDSMMQLEAKIVEAKAMKDQFIARARTAATATKVNDMLAGVGENSMSSFDRMKEKVEQLETQAEVSTGMLGAAKDTSLENRFKALEGGSKVDDELAKMKANMLPPAASDGPAKQLNPASSAVDDELEKMRRELQ